MARLLALFTAQVFLHTVVVGAVAQTPAPRPRLVVVIAIDQFPTYFLQRFRPHFGNGGFKLLLERGASFPLARYDHATTQTCPGHAVILTGSYAEVNGIVANSWYSAATGRDVYCAADTTVKLIGAATEGRSPRSLIDSTVGDRLKATSNGRSRIVTVAGKDRSAIMLGGHLADEVYWTEDTLFVTSTYYMKELPRWVRQFNNAGRFTAYAGRSWDRLLPASTYSLVGPDNFAAEENIAGLGRTFPHRLSRNPAAGKRFINALEVTPFHNEILADFAMQAVMQEQLGADEDPDVLGISFSANDRVGHAFGPDSHEVMDLTIRTDRLLERFFAFLSQQVGLDNLLIVLTADHGVAPLPEMMRRRDPASGAGRVDPAVIAGAAERALRARFGAPRRTAQVGQPTWIAYSGWPFLYFNLQALEDRGVAVAAAEEVAKAAVEEVPGVQQAFTATELERQRRAAFHSSAELSFYPGRSGNLYYVMRPYVLAELQRVGTNHGSPWDYDTSVPLLWLGAGITPGVRPGPASIADIAPTLSRLLGVAPPAGSGGQILAEMLR